jgi:hypothetical protein
MRARGGGRPSLFVTLQHSVDERPKIHLDCVKFTPKYRDGVRKVVANLGTGLVNLDRRKMALLRRVTGAMVNFRAFGDKWPGHLTSGSTGIAAASARLCDAPIGWG